MAFEVAHTVLGDIIDNGLEGEPVIECGSESLSVRFRTRSPFEGHIYVKGHYGTPGCRTDATLENTANLTVGFTECDVLRQRSRARRRHAHMRAFVAYVRPQTRFLPGIHRQMEIMTQ
ncbi:hypothetical protein ANCDUO_12544 [Ancylostoma duodenale]|uniref:ZP domain-containing protein n=1 Tax=Ancylostoma duodenale TaxID=51022 RepID=A0A0C2GJK0_9BILA|nr:hypothetical protein ANCDUO_12544 [Ancylostoma duodenale]